MTIQQVLYLPFLEQPEILLKVRLIKKKRKRKIYLPKKKKKTDKHVVELEYEAYVPMAEKVLFEIIQASRQKWDLKHVAIYHRIGSVPVGQVSVVIAVSSKHRGDAIHATEYLIDTLKEQCPIWKREVYKDGSVWKGGCNK